MDKKLILKLIKVGLVVVYALGFLMPFISGQIAGSQDFSYSAFNLEELNADKSADLYLIGLFTLLFVGIILNFIKPDWEKVINISSLGISAVFLLALYIQVFNDADLQIAISFNLMSVKIGSGIIFQVILLCIYAILEFLGPKMFNIEEY